MPRSPPAQSPAGRLCSTSVSPLACEQAGELGFVELVREQELDGVEPRLRGRSEAAEERQFGEHHGQVGCEFRHLSSFALGCATGREQKIGSVQRFSAKASTSLAGASTVRMSWALRIDSEGSRQRISSNSLTLSISVPIEMLVTRSRMNSSTTGT